MKLLFTFFTIALFATISVGQNVDYNARITQFYGSDCGEAGNEEWTWYGYLSDNTNFGSETSSGCVQCNRNANCTVNGTYASRSRTNIAATQLRARLDAWEDDNGSRCAYATGTFINNDDCRTQNTCTYTFTNPLEYQFTGVTSPTCGNNDFYLRTFYEYRYSTVPLSDATEYTATALNGGGNRPFWGSRGNWSIVGNDCATSGTISANQTSSFSTTVSCKRQVTFRWRVSSEACCDFLEVYVNGVRRNRISGTVGWTTVTLNLDFGSNVIEWRYDKDGSINSGLDRAFVDEIRFIDATNVIPGSITGNQVICSGGNPGNLASTAIAQSYSNTINYQWQQSNNNTTWTNIGGATGTSYNPPANLTQTRYYRRRAQDGCGFTAYTNTITVTVNPLPNGNLAGGGTICPSASGNITFNATAGTGPWDIIYNSNTLNNINTGTNIPVNPTTSTTYTLSSITDNNGCIRTTGLGGGTTVNVNTESTTPTIATVSGIQCPNTTTTLTASGGTAGTGSTIRWYTGPNGTGTSLGSGSSINVSPNATTTYYARREGTCNTTFDDSETVTVRNYAYAPVGSTASVGFCTDNSGWNHFFDASDNIILSIQGDLSGASSTPIARISNNNSIFQATEGPFTVASCTNGLTPGEERFEMKRSWNLDFAGTLNPPYQVRYYFPAAEKTAIETAAAAHIAANPACSYTYKSPNPNGFVWFKNVGSAYTAPTYGIGGIELAASNGSVNGINYSTMAGVTSFSGGTGQVILIPDNRLPVELVSFTGKHLNHKNQLNWATESETNNSHFLLQRTNDISNGFETIATIQGNGTTPNTQYYKYDDNQPLLGVNYYRLAQVDFDGTITYSNTIAIEIATQAGDYLFYPNPTKNKVTYQFSSDHTATRQIVVSNALGQVLQTQQHTANKGINNVTIDIHTYPVGTYLIQVLSKEGAIITTSKIIKQEE
jgi:hypothetical protein